MSRTATIERKTGETDIRLSLTLDGSGSGVRATSTTCSTCWPDTGGSTWT
jgi:imidazoleglycerol phosphate dehydratase HisB